MKQPIASSLVACGLAAGGLLEGQLDAGIALMEQGLAKGGVRRADELRLRLGEALALGKPQAATQTLASVKGGEGLSELAHLWSPYASIAPATAAAPGGGAAQTLK